MNTTKKITELVDNLGRVVGFSKTPVSAGWHEFGHRDTDGILHCAQGLVRPGKKIPATSEDLNFYEVA